MIILCATHHEILCLLYLLYSVYDIFRHATVKDYNIKVKADRFCYIILLLNILNSAAQIGIVQYGNSQAVVVTRQICTNAIWLLCFVKLCRDEFGLLFFRMCDKAVIYMLNYVGSLVWYRSSVVIRISTMTIHISMELIFSKTVTTDHHVNWIILHLLMMHCLYGIMMI